MKKHCIAFFIVCLLHFSFSAPLVFAAAWDTCKRCHNGRTAPDEKTMKEKYPTLRKFVEAAKKSDDPFMNDFKNDDRMLRDAGKEIGLR